MALYKLPYGEGNIEVEVSDKNFLYYASPVVQETIPDRDEVIQNAFDNPIGTARLEDIVSPENCDPAGRCHKADTEAGPA